MTIVFMVLLGLHVLHMLAVALRRSSEAGETRVGRYWIATSQTILFILAFILAWQDGLLGRSLLSPIHIAIGLAAGHLIFGLSLLIIHRSVEDATSYFFDFGGVWNFIVDHPYVLTRFIIVGVTEEIVWRAVAQPVVIGWCAPVGGAFGQWTAIAFVALAFALVHAHFFKNAAAVSGEFFLFALALGALYHWTGSLILVILVHTIRDVEICHLEYIIKVDEYGDEEKAAAEIEAAYMRPAAPKPDVTVSN